MIEEDIRHQPRARPLPQQGEDRRKRIGEDNRRQLPVPLNTRARVSTQRKRRDEGREKKEEDRSFIEISSVKSEATRSRRTCRFSHSLQVAQSGQQLVFTLGSWDNKVDAQC